MDGALAVRLTNGRANITLTRQDGTQVGQWPGINAGVTYVPVGPMAPPAPAVAPDNDTPQNQMNLARYVRIQTIATEYLMVREVRLLVQKKKEFNKTGDVEDICRQG